MARASLFLVSAGSSFVTGTGLVVDGSLSEFRPLPVVRSGNLGTPLHSGAGC
ncbi:hypothetical protein [Sphingomonas oligoaromativorans]|uniref:hypothetical protein n=1 Tax=Sphingomonas oligoaromativorans TaxID=575322 RepID=UPI003C7E7E8F